MALLSCPKEVNAIHCNAAIAVCARGHGLWLEALDFLGRMKNLKLLLGFTTNMGHASWVALGNYISGGYPQTGGLPSETFILVVLEGYSN